MVYQQSTLEEGWGLVPNQAKYYFWYLIYVEIRARDVALVNSARARGHPSVLIHSIFSATHDLWPPRFPAEIPTGLDLLRHISREELAARCPELCYSRFVAAALLRVAMGYLFLANALVILIHAEGVIEIFYDVS